VSDDDWFERALRETDRDDEREPDDGDAGTEPDEGRPDDGDAGTGVERGDLGDATADTGTPDPVDEDVFGGEEFGEGGFDEEGFDGDEFDGDGFGGLDGDGGVDDGGGGPDRLTGDAEDDRATPADTVDDADPFGGVNGEAADSATAGRESGDGDPENDPFGEDFGAAMDRSPGADGPDAVASGGGGADFGGGFGGFGTGAGGDDAGGGPEFDEEEFDSDIDRIDVGIEGLDEMILGGIPERSLMAVIGSAGTGKTTFGLQFLKEALENDGDAVYITLEESKEAILSTAEEKGWEYRRYAEEDRLAVIAMDPIEMANSLDSIRDDISRLITEFGADRLVLDSVSLLEMMYDTPSKRRSEVFDFARSLKQAGVTTMLTSEASQENAYASRHGIVEYLTDAVFVLQYVRPSDFRETRLAVEIQKIRDANHSRETKPYEIMSDGISVYRQANIF